MMDWTIGKMVSTHAVDLIGPGLVALGKGKGMVGGDEMWLLTPAFSTSRSSRQEDAPPGTRESYRPHCPRTLCCVASSSRWPEDGATTNPSAGKGQQDTLAKPHWRDQPTNGLVSCQAESRQSCLCLAGSLSLPTILAAKNSCGTNRSVFRSRIDGETHKLDLCPWRQSQTPDLCPPRH
jgi:hypothetical protein